MPGRGHDGDEADADRADDEADGEHPSRTHDVDEPAGDHHRDRRHHEIERDGEPQHLAAHGEFLRHRAQREPDREARAAADEHDQEACGEDDRAGHDVALLDEVVATTCGQDQ